MTIEQICRDPFRLCFPVGLALALHASALWMMHVFFDLASYPGLDHSRLFVGGFLYYFIVGFLMTAIPRFTQTPFATRTEVSIVAVQIIATLTSIVHSSETGFWVSLTVGWLALMTYATRRFTGRAHNPPPTFLFVGLGLLFGLVGLISFTLFQVLPATTVPWFAIGKTCLYDAMVLSLILGVGGFLIPGMLGFEQRSTIQISMTRSVPGFLSTIPVHLYVVVGLFAASVVLQVVDQLLIAYVVRAGVVVFVAIKYWKLFEKTERRTWFTRMIKWSCAMIVLGSLALVFTASQPIAAKHILYIGGYVFITLLVGARVTLSHSGTGTEQEERKHPYLTIGLFLVLAALTRATADYMPDIYMSHLGLRCHVCLHRRPHLAGFLFQDTRAISAVR